MPCPRRGQWPCRDARRADRRQFGLAGLMVVMIRIGLMAIVDRT